MATVIIYRVMQSHFLTLHATSLNLYVKYVLRFRNCFARSIIINVYQCDRLQNYLPQRFVVFGIESDRPQFKVTEIETRVTIASSFISVFKDLTTPKKITYLQYMQKLTNKEDLSPREKNNGGCE